MPNFTALAVLSTDYQKLTYVKQQNVALPFVWLKEAQNRFCGHSIFHLVSHLYDHLDQASHLKEGSWKCHNKYIVQDCSTSFLSMQQTYRCQLTVVAS